MGVIAKIKQSVFPSERDPHRKSKAQGMVEFALILPLVLLLIFGVIEFGRMLFIYSATFTASREAARYASAVGYGHNGQPRYKDCQGIQEAAMRMGSIAGIPGGNILIAYDSGPSTSNLYEACSSSVTITGEGKRVKVTVNTDFTPLVSLMNFPPVTITSTSARTIFKDVQISGVIPGDSSDPTPAPTADPSPDPPEDPTVIFINNMLPSSTRQGSRWLANAAISVQDDQGNPVSNVLVVGTFSAGNPANPSCTTVANGACTITSLSIPNNTNSVTFSVNGISGPLPYDPTLNNPNPPIITINR